MPTATLAIQTASTTDGTSFASGSFTPAAGDKLYVFAYTRGTAAAAPTVTDSQGVGFTLFDTETRGAAKIYSFESNGTFAASSMTVTFDCTGDDATGAILTVYRIADWGSRVQFKSSSLESAPSTPSITMDAAIDTNNCCVGVIGATSNSTTFFTAPSGWTEGGESAHATPNANMEAVHRNSGETNTTITWGASIGDFWSATIVEIAAPSGAYVPQDHYGTSGFFGL